jgi:ubiquinone/menaquinone biosynthesis C-methylase UbiE
MSKINKYGLCLEEYTHNFNNADIYFKRATGKLPEMEVSKALAKLIKPRVKDKDQFLDVGCGCGHYYKSLKRIIKKNILYTGIDPYKIFLVRAKKAWKKNRNVNFKKGDIHKIPFKKNNFEFVICNNVLLHLKSIEKPIKELLRVSKKYVILRTVVYNVSYKIQLVYNKNWWKYTKVSPINEFKKDGSPRSFSYFNIHSFDYLKAIIKKYYPRAKITFIKDNFYSKRIIKKSIKKEKRALATYIIGKEQVSGCLLQPHYFVIIKK